MAEDQYGEMRAIEPNWLRYLAAAARKGREGVNAVTPSVSFRGGPRHEIGDFLFGQAPEVLDQAAHGFYPWTGRGQTWTLKPEALDVLGMPTLGVGGAAAFGAKKGGQTLQRALARALREEAVEGTSEGVDLGRRDFLKKLGGTGVAAATAGSLPDLLRRGVDDMAETAIAKTGTRMARNLTGGDVQKSLAEYVSKKLVDEGYAEKAFKEGYRITPEDLAKVQDEILNYVDDSNMLDNLISKLPDDIPDDVIISRIVDPAQRKWPDYIGTKADLLGPAGKRKTQEAYDGLFQNLEGPEELLEWMVTGKTPKNLSEDWVKEYGPYIDEAHIGWIIEDSIGSSRVLDPLDRHGIIYEVLPDAVDDPDDFRDFYMKNKSTSYLD